MHIAFLHTAEVHVARFDALLDELAPGATTEHRVVPELLRRAQRDGIGAVRAETIAMLTELASANAVICTCSTLGSIADELARQHPHVVRIDRAMMEAACSYGPRILVALCLDSTRAATLDLLEECGQELGLPINAELVLVTEAWAAFEAGDMAAYADGIAGAVRQSVVNIHFDCVLLAQASMDIAAAQLADLGIPVLTSPRAAVLRALTVARRRDNCNAPRSVFNQTQTFARKWFNVKPY